MDQVILSSAHPQMANLPDFGVRQASLGGPEKPA